MHEVGNKVIKGAEYTYPMTPNQEVITSMPHWLSQEIAHRLDEKLSFIKKQPSHIVHSGCANYDVLLKRYPKTTIHLAQAEHLPDVWKKIQLAVCGKTIPRCDLDAMPARFADMYWSNLELQSIAEPMDLIMTWKKRLKPEGLIMFSYLGPDTGKELKTWLSHLPKGQFHGLDMHDVGDALVQAQFAEPVMDMEYITLTYEDSDMLIRDALALGLVMPEHLHDLVLEQGLDPYQLTIEVVYGHAWMPSQERLNGKSGEVLIPVEQIIRHK